MDDRKFFEMARSTSYYLTIDHSDRDNITRVNEYLLSVGAINSPFFRPWASFPKHKWEYMYSSEYGFREKVILAILSCEWKFRSSVELHLSVMAGGGETLRYPELIKAVLLA